MGEPFGVAELHLDSWDAAPEWLSTAAVPRLLGGEGRVLYPAFGDGLVAQVTATVAGSDAARGPRTVLFLFRGSAPLEFSVHSDRAQAIRLVPRRENARVFRRMLLRWWRAYHAQAESWRQQEPLGALADYTTLMLGRRLGLGPPLVTRLTKATASTSPDWETLELLAGLESLRAEIRQDTLGAAARRTEAAQLPLPPASPWLEPDWGELADVKVEPLALRVPHESFYIRFGSFENYLWFQQLGDRFGGDLAAMAGPVSVHRDLNTAIQQQLGLRQSALAEVFGSSVVADVALVGFDFYTQEGPAIGVLLQARNALLATDVNQQRRTTMKELAASGAKEETVRLADRDVSFISTPDNRLRSFYAADGNYHLVTNCQALARRFLEAAQGERSLGASLEFRRARQRMPLDREDTLFAYFSTACLQQLVSPRYQIERARRLRASTDMELQHLAELAARAEGHRPVSLGDLIRLDMLPVQAAVRPEGGEIVREDGQWRDTLRGRRGVFLPIPDVPLELVTSSELAEYQARARYYQANWKQFDPLYVGVRRYGLDGDGKRERLAVQAHVSPLDETKYGWVLSILGPPTAERVRPAPGDLVAVQAYVQGGLLAGTVPPHHLFAGLHDTPALLQPTGFLSWLAILLTTPAYLGATPNPGFLDWLPFQLGGGPPDLEGYSQLPLGFWRRQWPGYSLVSPHRGVLEAVTPYSALEPAAHPAQLRVYVGDLSESALRGWLDDLAAERALQASYGNARAAHVLAGQFALDGAQAWATTNDLLAGTMQCPLGGTYELRDAGHGLPVWASTHWNRAAVLEYGNPLLGWFRGINADLTKTPDGVIVRAEIDVEGLSAAKKAELPLFDLFRGTRPSAAPAPGDAAPKQRRF